MVKDNRTYDKGMISKMMKMHSLKDTHTMLEIMNGKNYSSISEYQDIILTDQNHNCIKKIKNYASKKSTFFDIGTEHLAGNDGVIHLLRAEDYILTPVFLARFFRDYWSY